MRHKNRFLFIVPPHIESSMPLLAPNLLASCAQKARLPFCAIDLNASYRKQLISAESGELVASNLGLFFQKNPDSLSPGSYWSAIDRYRSFLPLSKKYFPEFNLHWDGAVSQYAWNRFSDQQRFLTIRRHSLGWHAAYSGLWPLLNSFAPTVIGLSVTFDTQFLEALALADALHLMVPEMTIVMGGAAIKNCFSKNCVSFGPLQEVVDILYIGDGEFLISALAKINVNDVKARARFVSGEMSILWADDLIEHARREGVLIPVFDSKTLALYSTPALILPYRMAGRCYWGKCRFCADHQYGGSLWIEDETDVHLDGIQQMISRHDAVGIFFLDSAMSASCMKTIASRIIKRGLDIKWGVNARFEKKMLEPGLLELLAQSGCCFLRFGLESGSQRILNLMHKGVNVGHAAAIVRRCRDTSILTHTYVMVGYPGEKEEDRRMTSAFLMDQKNHPDSFNISRFLLYPESPLAGLKQIEPTSEDEWNVGEFMEGDERLSEFISNLERAFSEMYGPSRVLMSPAHTLALHEKTVDWSTAMIETREGGE